MLKLKLTNKLCMRKEKKRKTRKKDDVHACSWHADDLDLSTPNILSYNKDD